MDPIITPLVLGALFKAGAGVAGYFMQRASAEESQDLIREATDAYGNLDESKLQEAAARILGPSRLAQIQQDPSYRQAGQQALASLKNVSDSGGLTLADQAVADKLHNQTSRLATGRREAALQQMRQRGTLDSGDELTAMLSASQEGVNREAEHDQATAGQAQNRARQAIMDRASLAGQMGDRDWRQQSEVARAGDDREEANLKRGDMAAQGQYTRDLQGMDRRYNAAKQEAGYRQDQNDRLTGAVTGGIKAAGDAFTGSAPSWGTPAQGAAVSAPLTAMTTDDADGSVYDPNDPYRKKRKP
jgi:hypothetical protein